MQAGVEAERTLDDLSVANEQLRVDLEKWKEAKDKELGKVMGTFADNHINHHTKVLILTRDSGTGIWICHASGP